MLRKLYRKYVDPRTRSRIRARFNKERSRVTACNDILEAFQGTQYLEIGVSHGYILDVIRAENKIGVDPKPPSEVVKKIDNATYFSMPSDEFFATEAPALLGDRGIDVALVDGLHEYRQALRDVENCLAYLNEDGVIVMHDCNPSTESAGVPPSELAAARQRAIAEGQPNPHVWNGDVWKTVVHLRSTRSDLHVFVLDCDHGLGFVAPGSPDDNLDCTQEQIDAMTYQDLLADRHKLLNLKNPAYFESFMEQRLARRAARPRADGAP